MVKRVSEGLVVLAASCLWDAARLADRHLAENLAQLRPVLYAEPPISRRRAVREGMSTGPPKLRQVHGSLWVLGPVVLPAKTRWPVSALTPKLDRRAIRRAVEELGGQAQAMICSASTRDVYEAVDALRVYWVKDDYVAGSHLIDLPRRRVERAVASLVTKADEVVVVSPGLLDSFQRAGYEPTFIPNGVNVAHFSEAKPSRRDDVELPPPIVGYVGGISDRIDPEILAAVAERGWSLLLVGPASRVGGFEELRPILELPNVRWIGEQPFDQLPTYLATIDVGIVPYRTDDFNLASFPLKALEYLAAGREVVASDLPALRWLESENIYLASTPRSFAETVQRALARMGDPVIEAVCRSFATEHDWSERTMRFLDLIEGRADSRAEPEEGIAR